MGENVIVIGGGGHAKVVVSTLIELKIQIQAIYDDDPGKWGKDLCGVKIVGPLSDLEGLSDDAAVLAIGDNRTRSILAERFRNFRWLTAVHPRAFVHPSVSIGKGTVVFAGAVIQPDVMIGDHCIVNTNAAIDHDCALGDFTHVGPGACLAGEVSVKEGAFLATGGVAIIGRKIGKWSIVGAGGVVTEDIPDNVTAVGVPAKVIKENVKNR
ncbi:MAG TPA: acetyltransferase [Syntrophorhabdaceae bacterium]|nr:acetyltransferase [Syntrophorhabdaceae bacterium]